MSHLNCTVNNAYRSLDSNQGFSLWYGIISLPQYMETIKNVVNSIEHDEPIMCSDCLHCGVQLMFLFEFQLWSGFFGAAPLLSK